LRTSFVYDTNLSVGKEASVSYKSKLKNPDGSITVGSCTTVNGVVRKDSWNTQGANKFKFSESWSEDVFRNKISLKQVFDGYTFSAVLVNNTMAKASLKSANNKQTYTGTGTYDPAKGIITFTTTKSAKDGSTATYKYDPTALGGATQTVVVTTKGGVAGSPITHTTPNAAPNPTTPDLRALMQNQPPQ
jgi:hypothetical protein